MPDGLQPYGDGQSVPRPSSMVMVSKSQTSMVMVSQSQTSMGMTGLSSINHHFLSLKYVYLDIDYRWDSVQRGYVQHFKQIMKLQTYEAYADGDIVI